MTDWMLGQTFVCHISGIIDILRTSLTHKLDRYPYLSMRPCLFDNYHQITYLYAISVQYHVDFMPKKAQKCHLLYSRFFESARYVLAYNSGYDEYFSITLIDGLQKEIPQILKEPYL